ncbi:phage antirepressor [Viridibacillus arvi]|uniref:phage antirepressor n=1 Tax=Viridibacillus arvi TaxID=263475 RepID=UPI003D2C57A4
MDQLQMFNFENQGVRVIEKDGEPWFIGKDVANILGYSNPRDALSKHVEAEDKGVAKCDTLGGSQNLSIINESDMYSLVLSSKLESSKRFKRWVTSQVLPSIRKHGAYMTSDTIEQVLLNPDTIIKIATQLKEEQTKRREAEMLIQQQQPKVLFADSVAASQTSILVRELAKLLKQNSVDIGEKRLYVWLRENGYLIKRLGTDYNTPTQRSMNLGLFEIKETPINHNSGLISISKTTKVTGKGQIYFINKFLKIEIA